MGLERYELIEEIGAGATAKVYAARRKGPLGFSRIVAIKRVHENLVHDRNAIATLVDEARLTSGLRHPNVVSILDVVSVAGELWLVMDFVDGVTLAAAMRKAFATGSPVPLDVASAIVSAVLRGLHAAHEARDSEGRMLGLVHRDAGPDNVLLGRNGEVRIGDFGIARARGRLQSTAPQMVKGKVGYMAPEQLRGRKVDARADVYASGVVLWELVAGVRAFDGVDAEVVERVLVGKLPPPSEHRTDHDGRLDAIVLRATSRSPDARFASAAAFASALEQAVRPAGSSRVVDWLERRGLLATRGTVRAKAKPRHRWLIDAGVLLVLGGFVAWWVYAPSVGPERAPKAMQVIDASPPPSLAIVPEEPPPRVVAAPSSVVVWTSPSVVASVPPRVAAPKGVDCTIPFTVDAHGDRIYRRECMR